MTTTQLLVIVATVWVAPHVKKEAALVTGVLLFCVAAVLEIFK